MEKCKISKYFNNQENVNAKSDKKLDSQVSKDSPYKNILSNIKKLDLDSSGEANDFKTPKCLNMGKNKVLLKTQEATKSFNKQKLNKRKTNIRKQPTIKSFTNKCDENDTNVEHLQMAIALSRSLQNDSAEENREEGNESVIKNKNKQMMGLEQFRFKSNNSKSEIKNRITDKRKGKVKSKYITPTLMMRTEEERNEIINVKISEILSTNNTVTLCCNKIKPYKPLSNVLQQCINEEHLLFKKSRNSIDIPLDDFYVKSLNLDMSTVICGSVLKDWGSIPGRCVSPLPITITSESETLSLIDSEDITNHTHDISTAACKLNDCFSPDLFDSDDEKQLTAFNKKNKDTETQSISNQEQESSDEQSESLLSTPIKKTQKDKSISNFKDNLDLIDNIIFEKENGVCVYENFVEDVNQIDLTQSSSDESDLDAKTVEGMGDSCLKTGISEIFTTGMNLRNDTVKSPIQSEVLHELSKNHSMNFSPSTHKELFDNDINLSCLSGETNKPPDYTHSFNSTQSQESIVISDDEINYSCNYGTPTNTSKQKILHCTSFDFSRNSAEKRSSNSNLYQNSFNSEIEENIEEIDAKETEECLNTAEDDTILYTVENNSNSDNEVNEINLNETSSTPKTDMIIKTNNVTPSLNYNEMSTPKIVRELGKYGIKPLKRRRGIQLLNYIYDSTHPLLNPTDDVANVEENVIKKRKITSTKSNNLEDDVNILNKEEPKLLVDDILGANEELIFERNQSKRKLSCRTPLHIAWHNLVASDPNLQESILLYEPLHLEVLYRTLKSHGYKYHIQDLLTFLDKKCITIRTEQKARQRHNNFKKNPE